MKFVILYANEFCNIDIEVTLKQYQSNNQIDIKVLIGIMVSKRYQIGVKMVYKINTKVIS
jgi:hypothetical protein